MGVRGGKSLWERGEEGHGQGGLLSCTAMSNH